MKCMQAIDGIASENLRKIVLDKWMKIGEALINGLVHPNALHSNQTVCFSKSLLDSAVVILFRRMFHCIFHPKIHLVGIFSHFNQSIFFSIHPMATQKFPKCVFDFRFDFDQRTQFILALFLLIARIWLLFVYLVNNMLNRFCHSMMCVHLATSFRVRWIDVTKWVCNFYSDFDWWGQIDNIEENTLKSPSHHHQIKHRENGRSNTFPWWYLIEQKKK